MFNAAHYVCVCECLRACVCHTAEKTHGQIHELHFQGFKTKNFTGSGFWKTRTTRQNNSSVQMGESSETGTSHISRVFFFFKHRQWQYSGKRQEEKVEIKRD